MLCKYVGRKNTLQKHAVIPGRMAGPSEHTLVGRAHLCQSTSRPCHSDPESTLPYKNTLPNVNLHGLWVRKDYACSANMSAAKTRCHSGQNDRGRPEL
ncbi:hypothetical protein QUF72_00240 [Desulfobacterales bacterium HSG2]|nr:hypothetical protein [Desulfobacterales bacterium HSG2]